MKRKAWFALAALPIVAVLTPIVSAKSVDFPQLHLPFLETMTPHGDHAPGLQGASAPAASVNQSLVGDTNPIQIGPPVQVPNTKPVEVTVLSNHLFNNANNVQTNVLLPQGNWSKVVMTITGTQSGVQFDRLMQVWAGNTQIFTGVTPEPTKSGIAWKVQEDITSYLPILQGNQVFTSECDNYPNSTYTGIPDVTITLDFYPATGHSDANTQAPAVGVPQQSNPNDLFAHGLQTQILSLQSNPGMTTLHPSNTFTSTVNLPNDLVAAQLRVNLIPQIGDEFWWGELPAFREIEVSIDGRPAGVVWPKPYIYTGGVNPMLWRPVTGIHTMDIPAYQVDLSPFAGMLSGGKHTITMTVQNNGDYWLVSGSLFLTEAPGVTTGGNITEDTLSFPAVAPTTNTPGYGSGNLLTSQTANRDYTISGVITAGKSSWTSKVQQTMEFSNDQTNTSADYFGLIHGNQIVKTDSIVSGQNIPTVDWNTMSMYTLDAADGFIQDTASSNFTLPTNVTQTMQERHQVTEDGRVTYKSNEYENIEGYAVLQTGSGSSQVALGSTTAYARYANSLGDTYNRVLIARAGKVISDQVSGNMGE